MTDNSNEMDGKYLTFWTEGQLFGVSISDVVQIVGIQKITSIPGFPNYVKGVINLRGSIIPVIDVRLRLNKQEAPYNEHTCIIVTSIQQSSFGFIVDSVDEVTKIDDENISITPKVSAGDVDSYLNGIAKLENKVVLLLNIEKILNYKEISDIAQNNI
ncbi:MAG: purine-binding chemotaxis protein CheW [Caproiciproducens sp.]|nr:purine-binding chemotaxis protein CheW [Caproiciproducens sp.]